MNKLVDHCKPIRLRHSTRDVTKRAKILRDHVFNPSFYDIEFDGKEWTVSKNDIVIGTDWNVENCDGDD